MIFGELSTNMASNRTGYLVFGSFYLYFTLAKKGPEIITLIKLLEFSSNQNETQQHDITWEDNKSYRFCFLIFMIQFWRQNDVMNMPNFFEIHKYTNLIIAFERTSKMRDITETISRLSYHCISKDINFSNSKTRHYVTKKCTKWRKFQISKMTGESRTLLISSLNVGNLVVFR